MVRCFFTYYPKAWTPKLWNKNYSSKGYCPIKFFPFHPFKVKKKINKCSLFALFFYNILTPVQGNMALLQKEQKLLLFPYVRFSASLTFPWYPISTLKHVKWVTQRTECSMIANLILQNMGWSYRVFTPKFASLLMGHWVDPIGSTLLGGIVSKGPHHSLFAVGSFLIPPKPTANICMYIVMHDRLAAWRTTFFGSQDMV